MIESSDSGGAMIAFSMFFSLPPRGGEVPLDNFRWSEVANKQARAGTTWTTKPLLLVGHFDGDRFVLDEPPRPSTESRMRNERRTTPHCDESALQALVDRIWAVRDRCPGVQQIVAHPWNGHCGVEVTARLDTSHLRQAVADVGGPDADVVYRFQFEPVPLP